LTFSKPPLYHGYMKIAFFEIEEWEIPFLQKALVGNTVTFSPQHLDEVEAKKLADVEVLSVFIYSMLTPELLEKMPNLKLIVTRSTGFDHIDLEYCKKKKIVVTNIPHYGANTVAEHAFALLLALSRKLIPSIERTRRGNFELDASLRGFDLHEKTIGVVGIGNIGAEVIRIAKGFGMHVVAYTHHPSEEIARKLRITFLSLPELLKVSDVVTLHVPYSKKTHHLINKKNIKHFKQGSILINTARGGLIETEAILYGLDKGKLGGVGLDVLEEECGIKEERQLLAGNFKKECDLRTQLYNHVLLTKENVLITPHNAFNSNEALQRILDVTVENIVSFGKGKPLNIV
jgi:D-lactate dehydrogenase